MQNTEIDFVITWVDGNDPEWRKLRDEYSGTNQGDARSKRFRDWGVLRYWFRGIERYAPWVRHVHFVTFGHTPEWLNTSNPKLHVVHHSDFIPNRYLPTFSCRTIEFNLHRIPNLSETFVYFNDDMFLTNHVNKTDFFVDGLPCDTAILDAGYIYGGEAGGEKIPVSEYNSSPVINMVPLNRNFDKRMVIKTNRRKWCSLKYGPQMIRTFLLSPWKHFTGIKSFHVPYSLLKSTYVDLWDSEPELLDFACSHKFRDSADVSSRLLSYWQIAKGDFSPRRANFGKMFYLTGDEKTDSDIYKAIEGNAFKAICINDEHKGDNVESTRLRLSDCFEQILPVQSSFEK